MKKMTVAALSNARYCLVDVIDVLEAVSHRPRVSRRPGTAASLQDVVGELEAHVAVANNAGLNLSFPKSVYDAATPAPGLFASSERRAAHRRAVIQSLSACRLLLRRVRMLLAEAGVAGDRAPQDKAFEPEVRRHRRRSRGGAAPRQSYRKVITAG